MKKGEPRPEKAAAAGEQTSKSSDLVADIAMVIEKSGETGLNKDEILAGLVKRFPDRNPEAMRSVIDTAVPDRISKEKFIVEETADGKFRKA